MRCNFTYIAKCLHLVCYFQEHNKICFIEILNNDRERFSSTYTMTTTTADPTDLRELVLIELMENSNSFVEEAAFSRRLINSEKP